MPIERRLDAATGVLWTTMRGPIAIHDMRQHLDAVSEMGGYRYSEIIDTRLAEPLFTAKDLPMLANHGRRLFSRLKMAPRAVIVNEDDLMYFGVSRIFGLLASPWVTFRVFDDVDAAVAFIEATTAAPQK
jgi:hypothetical protein